MRSGVLSVDTNVKPYFELKTAIRDERILLPRIEKLKAEILGLIYDPRKVKVDHNPGATKDLSDAVAGTVHTLGTRRESYSERTVRESNNVSRGVFTRAQQSREQPARRTPRRLVRMR